jgi:predicted ester cyclase
LQPSKFRRAQLKYFLRYWTLPSATSRNTATFPDFRIRVEDMIAEGDRVVTRVTGEGTHAGVWMDIEPTGSLVKVKGVNIDRVSNDRIVEHWGEADTVGMLFQMGVNPFDSPSRSRMK